MGEFQIGSVVMLKSDNNVKGAVIGMINAHPENRYQVFCGNEVREFFASQLVVHESKSVKQFVKKEHFYAELTATLIRNPSLSSLYSLNAARIDFIPHQFRPVLKFIRADRPRILIADGVGVGKTIEAGLVLRELQARRNMDSILIICPRPLVAEKKWEMEMRRFDENFIPLNGEMFRHCIQELDFEGEWPERYKKCIIPYSLFDEGNVFGSQEGKRKLGLLNAELPKFDLVIVDEAHHVRNTATFGYRAVSHFCDSAEAVIFLTATPVQMEEDDLFVLLNLLRPDIIIDKNTFHDMAQPNEFISRASTIVRRHGTNWSKNALGEIRNAIATNWGSKVFHNNIEVERIIQRLSQEKISAEDRISLISDIENLHTFANIISRTRRRDIGEFTLRKPITVKCEFTEKQQEFYDRLLAFITAVLKAVHCSSNIQFMMTTIRRQTASCLFGVVPFLEDILYRNVTEIIDGDELEILQPNGENEFRSIFGEIDAIIKCAKELPEQDNKYDAVKEILEKKQQDEKNKVMIFSSFRHTLFYLYNKLSLEGYRVGVIHGGVNDEERRSLRYRFNPETTQITDETAIDVLLFSEVGCEGLDYQFCDCMVNYDLPWNPMKVEQRIGRIDRNGQTSESIQIYNMIVPGTVDADIYERCLLRIGIFHHSIGDCEEILGGITSEIKSLAENFGLTEDERNEKLQQMTDNKVRLLKEQEVLEEEQKDLLGINIDQSEFDKDLKEATNYWLSEQMVQNLLHKYLQLRLGNQQEYILGEKELKTLRLSQASRMKLLEDYKGLELPRTELNRSWEKWLKSGEQHLPITFEIQCSKENSNVMLVSLMHPLIKQASEYVVSDVTPTINIEVISTKYPEGKYYFSIYQWKLLGEKEDIKILPISENKELNEDLIDLIRSGVDKVLNDDLDTMNWKSVEDAHYELWHHAMVEHKCLMKNLIDYKEASLTTSHIRRIGMLQEQLDGATNVKYRVMTEGKLRIANEDYERRIETLRNAREKADILFELLSYGVLDIKNS